MKHFASLFAGALLLATILPATAGEGFSGTVLPATANEVFLGTILEGKVDIPVKLTFTADKQPGADGGAIRFEDQWKCGFGLQFSKTRDKVDTYSLQGAGKGLCISLQSGYLHRGQGAHGSTVIQLFDSSNEQLVYTVELVPTGS